VTPAVTVVVPTKDRVEVFGQTLRGVLGQRGVDLHVLVVDDGSSPADALALQSIVDPRVEVLRNERSQGPSAARNRGMAAATTRWVAFCDDDDVWAPDKLFSQLTALERSGARWSCTASLTVSPTLAIVGHRVAPARSDVLADLLAFNVVPGGGSSVVVDADLLAEVEGFDETMNRAEDWDLWIRLATRSPVAAVDRPLVGYRVWPGSESLDTDGMANGHAEVVRRYAHLAAEHGVALDEAAVLKYLAKQELRAGRRAAAARRFAAMPLREAAGGWARAGLAMVAPDLVDRLGNARSARAVPAAWRAEAAPWLAALVAAPVTLDPA
jgi:glycosyltransferase involved in cell wall biosynthesis